MAAILGAAASSAGTNGEAPATADPEATGDQGAAREASVPGPSGTGAGGDAEAGSRGEV